MLDPVVAARLILVALLLTGCAGTQLVADGSMCGQPFHVQLIDRKDRAGFSVEGTCADGSKLLLTSSDSMTSTVIASQAELASKLGDVIGKLAGAAAPGIALDRQSVDQASPATLEEVERLIWAKAAL